MWLSISHSVTVQQIAASMQNFSNAAAKGYGDLLMNALLDHWKRDTARIFLGAMEDALLRAEREADIQKAGGE